MCRCRGESRADRGRSGTVCGGAACGCVAAASSPADGLGAVYVEISAGEADDPDMATVEAYLTDDPFLALPHLRIDGDTVGIYLSDLVSAVLEYDIDESLFDAGLSWADNDDTAQVFRLVAYSEPGQPLDLNGLGRAVGRWLGRLDVDAMIEACRQPESLATISRILGCLSSAEGRTDERGGAASSPMGIG